MQNESHPRAATAWPEEQARAVGRNIETLRRKMRLSAEGLSSLTANTGHRVPRSSIQKMENGGKKTVALHEALVLARCLGVPIGYLLNSPYKPAEFVRSVYEKGAVPAYWEADAISPTKISWEDKSNPNAEAVDLVQLRAHRMSGLQTGAAALGRNEANIRYADDMGNTVAADKLRTFQERLLNQLANLQDVVDVWDPRMEELGIELWRYEDHKIPRSYYKGLDPEEYDPWYVKHRYKIYMDQPGDTDA